jgi:hypothetical protein
MKTLVQRIRLITRRKPDWRDEMIRVIAVCCLLGIILLGCTSKEIVEPSPFFRSENITLQGKEGKIGILNNSSFTAGKGNKYMWHFWGTKEELSQKPFKVVAIDLKTEKEYPVLVEGAGTVNEKLVWEYEGGPSGPVNGADAHIPSYMELPTKGLWELNAYLDDEFFGSIIVSVK